MVGWIVSIVGLSYYSIQTIVWFVKILIWYCCRKMKSYIGTLNHKYKQADRYGMIVQCPLGAVSNLPYCPNPNSGCLIIATDDWGEK